MRACPSAATLAGLGDDSLGGATGETLEQHIEGCPLCQAKLERLARNDAGAQDPDLTLPCPDSPPEIPGFAIERELGRGSMGVVYQAFQPSLDRRVALKVVRSGPAAGAHEHARWLREARSFSQVSHDRVVRLYQVGEAAGWLYLVLELVPGGTLQDRLDVPYAAQDAARLLETIAQALAAIHRAGLVHLDLKPSNILLDAVSETPRVGDFGIAYRWNDPQASLATASLAGPLGTPSYMPPEQVTGDRPAMGPAADIYGLGAILYHLLTGRPPFAAPSVLETLDQVRHQDPVPPRRLNPRIPRDLETICLKCLEKDPARRYASAEALAEDVRAWLDGRPIAARPVSFLDKTWRACRRRPVVAALATTLSLTLATGFLSIVLLWRHAEAERIRAEADFEVAGLALGEFIDLSRGEPFHATTAARARLIPLLQRTREHCLELAQRRPDHPMIHLRLALADHHLALLLLEQGRLGEARPLLVEARARWDKAGRNAPEDPAVSSGQLGTFEMLASLAEQEGKIEESAGHLAKAVALGERLLRLQPGLGLVAKLADWRWRLAGLLARLGEHERARSLIVANIRMLDNPPVSANHPELTLRRVLAHEDLRRLHASSTAAPSATVAEPGGDPLTRLLSAGADHLATEAWAELFAQVLRSTTARQGTSPSRESESGYYFTHLLVDRAAEQRRSGHLDEARRITDRIHAFARLLLARYPDQTAAHLALCVAFQQRTKNAWRTNDRADIERNWRLALSEARQALILDPQNDQARYQVTDLERRLKDLLAP